MIITPQLAALFENIKAKKNNILVNSTAGSGKTTSIMESLKLIDPAEKKFIGSFTQKITGELEKRVKEIGIKNCTVGTLNSIGWQAVKRYYPGCKLYKYKTGRHLSRLYYPNFEYDKEEKKKFFGQVKFFERMIGILKAYVTQLDEVEDRWPALAEYHSIDLPKEDRLNEMICSVYKRVIADTTQFDFDDQKFRVVYDNIPLPTFDRVLIDESQDCNLCDLYLIESLGHSGTQFTFVGDDEQAIYLFRGACSDALSVIADLYSTVESPLTVCWRCPEAVIREAQQVSKKITSPSPNPNGEGRVETIEAGEFIDHVQEGAFALSRTSAVAVSFCLRSLQAGKRATVLGREIEAQLLDLIDKLSDGLNIYSPEHLAIFKGVLEKYAQDESARLINLNLEMAAQQIQDTCDTIGAFIEVSGRIVDIKGRIEEIFTDTIQPGITFMTLHKAKGLENPVVYFLDEGNCPHPSAKTPQALTQENNLRFIGITRARKELVFVRSEPKKRRSSEY